MKAVCYKGNVPVKTFYHVIKVNPNHKYGYFEIHTKIYHHEIIDIVRYNDADTVICFDEENRERIKTYYAN